MANEKTPVVWDDDAKKHRPLGSGEKMGGLSASSMISSDSGNLLQQGSDGLMLVTGGSIADPRADNLLEESDNGKLQVTSDRIVEWLDGHPQAAAAIADAVKVVSGDDGNVIVQGTDKGAYLPKQAISGAVAAMTDAQKNQLADAISSRIASDIADGKTVVASGGKLTFDPTNATAAQKKAINQALADADSGLVVDSSTGKLQVDFSNMPTDKFEDLLKGLKMQVPLTSNMSLYVSTNNSAASDVLDDGRGTQAKPFKTIQACVNYATSTYAVGRYHIAIRVVAGTYNESVTLPEFDRGSGYIEIRSDSGARDVIVRPTLTSSGTRDHGFDCSGGYWAVSYIEVNRVENPTMTYGTTPSCFYVHNSGATLELYGIAAMQSMPSSPVPLGGEDYNVRVFDVDNGATLRLHHGVVASTISVQKPASGTPTVTVFSIERGGTLQLVRTRNSSAEHVVSCSGSCDTFIDVWQNGSVNTYGTGTIVSFSGTVTGKRYNVTGGSSIAGSLGATYFPGDSAGTVQASTYSWYQGVDPA